MNTFYATKPFWWDGKNINTGDAVKMKNIDSKWMLARGAVTETAPKKAVKKAVKKFK